MQRSHGVDDAVGTELLGVVVLDDEAGLDAGADDDRLGMKILLAEVLQRVQDGRHHRCDDDVVDVLRGQSRVCEQLVDDHAVFVGGFVLIRLHTPVLHQPVAVVDAQHDIRISYVECQ